MPGWLPGDPVVLRYLRRGLPIGAFPTRVVSAENEHVLWLAAGTTIRAPGLDGRYIREAPLERRFTERATAIERTWQGGGIVIVGRPGRAHSIWLFWDDERFAGWYVNLEAPWRPNRLGFDTEDHTLDIWVEADGSWRWKDEDELQTAVLLGYFTVGEAAAFRAEGERVVAEWPFPTGWEEWRPEPSLEVPAVPAGWDAIVAETPPG